jgi:hypothetical protein
MTENKKRKLDDTKEEIEKNIKENQDKLLKINKEIEKARDIEREKVREEEKVREKEFSKLKHKQDIMFYVKKSLLDALFYNKQENTLPGDYITQTENECNVITNKINNITVELAQMKQKYPHLIKYDEPYDDDIYM